MEKLFLGAEEITEACGCSKQKAYMIIREGKMSYTAGKITKQVFFRNGDEIFCKIRYGDCKE